MRKIVAILFALLLVAAAPAGAEPAGSSDDVVMTWNAELNALQSAAMQQASDAAAQVKVTMPEASSEDMTKSVPEIYNWILEPLVERMEDVAYGYGDPPYISAQLAADIAEISENPYAFKWRTLQEMNQYGYLLRSGRKVPEHDSVLPPELIGTNWHQYQLAVAMTQGLYVLPFDSTGRVILDTEHALLQPGQHALAYAGEVREMVNFPGVPVGPEFTEGYQTISDQLVAVAHMDLIVIGDTNYITNIKSMKDPVRWSHMQEFLSRSDKLRISAIRNADGTPCSNDKPISTGQEVEIQDISIGVVKKFTLVVTGDVVGNGVLNISQLARLAQAIARISPLTGPYAMAADVNGSGNLDIADLSMLARMLTQ